MINQKAYLFFAQEIQLLKNLNQIKLLLKRYLRIKFKHNKNSYYVDDINEKNIQECDTIVISDIEHQINPTSNLLKLSKLINDDAKIIVLSKNMIWMMIIKFLKYFFKFSPIKNNFLPASYLKNLFSSCNLEVVRSEKIIALPIFIPFLTNIINRIFRLPILNLLK